VHQLLGWEPDELIGRPVGDLIHPSDRPRISALRDSFYREGRAHDRVSIMVSTASGGYRQITLRAQPILDNAGTVSGAVITLSDTHDRDSALRALATLSEANRVLVRTTDEQTLLDDMCTTLVETGRYALAWYGRALPDTARSVIVFASNGATDYLDGITVSWGDNDHGRGPTGRALRTGQTQVQNQLADDPAFHPWAEAASRSGFACTLALPVRVDGAVDGALMVYAHESNAFDSLTQELLEDLAADLGYGIARMRADRQLADSEHRYRLLAENSSDVIMLSEDGRTFTWVSESAEAALGWRPADLIGQPAVAYIHPDDISALVESIERSEATGAVARLRSRWRRPDGSYVWVESAGRHFTDPAGAEGRVISVHVIEDQVRAEQELAERDAVYRLLAENSSDVVLLATEIGSTCLWASPSTQRVLGWEPEDFVGHHAQEFIHPDDIDPNRAQRNAPTQGDVRQQYRVRCKDGTFLWMEALWHRIPSPQDGEQRIVVRLRDIHEQKSAEQELSEREALYRLLAENSSDVILLAAAPHAECLWASPSVTRALGWSPADLVGRTPTEFVHPDDLDFTSAREALVQNQDIRQKYRLRRPDGTYVWMEASIRTVAAGRDDLQRYVISLRDVDEQVAAQRQLAAREETYRLLAENASDIVWQVDDAGTLLWLSPSIESELGWPRQQLIGSASSDLIADDDRGRFAASVERVRAGQTTTGEYRVRHADGSLTWMAIALHAVSSVDSLTPNTAARIATLRNVNEAVESRQHLEFALQHDQSTGLPTRHAMRDRIDREIASLGKDGRIAVLCIGIDLLKDVNDAYGHHVGDLVIGEIATRIVHAMGRSDQLGRGSGDEFIVVLPGIHDAAQAAEIAERIRTGVHGEMASNAYRISPSVSIGIALGRGTSPAEDLLRDATLALHKSKQMGRDRWSFADPDLANEAAQRMALESSIRLGLAAGEFEPWFQPIVRLADGKVAGYEALVRWRHQGTAVEPDSFLGVAARTPLITDIDLAMVEPVIATLSRQPEDVFIAVNVTGATLARTPYARNVRAALEAYGVDPTRLHIEVTETMLLRLDAGVLEQVQALADMGAKWYVDDFGTGYSSISHLRDLPVAGLKLDRSFTMGLDSDDDTPRRLADGLIGLAAGLGLDTVAEGVETEEQEAYLRSKGWTHGQGYRYGRAAPLP
jgi:diguanylate cyclase (GGDEF)-like protein/PAS domain S-box-containing protein